MTSMRSVVAAMLPRPIRDGILLRERLVRATPPIGSVKMGDLRRVSPVSSAMGTDRGQPVDRFYIESFLRDHGADIRGAVLEIGDPAYTRRFGSGVTQSDVLHAAQSPDATIVADLSRPTGIESDRFDCMILTQTLQFIYDLPSTVRELHRIARPGGVVLATVPGISQISRYDMDRWGDFWRFTSLSARRIFEEMFGTVEVTAYGNVLTATAFLQGIVAEELRPEELAQRDSDYELTIGIRAVK